MASCIHKWIRIDLTSDWKGEYVCQYCHATMKQVPCGYCWACKHTNTSMGKLECYNKRSVF